MNRAIVRDRLFSRLVIDDTGCLLWTGPKDTSGYGRVTINQRKHSVHRLFYLIFRSEVPLMPADDPAPVRFEDAEVDALAVIVDRMAVLRSETDEVTVQRVIRYLCDRYGTDGA